MLDKLEPCKDSPIYFLENDNRYDQQNKTNGLCCLLAKCLFTFARFI